MLNFVFTRKEKRTIKKVFNIICNTPALINAIIASIKELCSGTIKTIRNYKSYHRGGYS